MGYALAEAALKAGHKVTLISASDLQPPVGVDFVGVETAAEMFEAVKKFFKKCDCLIMAAAVSDYTPIKKSKVKIKRSKRDLVIRLKPTVDILAWASKQKARVQKTEERKIIVGFALEDKDIRRNAEKKLKQKNLDMIIANRPQAIGSENSSVDMKTKYGNWIKWSNKSKDSIASIIITHLEQSRD
jgi:phosphopantothenoylcysteine decarboxylase/phosphopantothenate--cysteine ligase